MAQLSGNLLTPAEGPYTSLFATTSPQVSAVKRKYDGAYLMPFVMITGPREEAKDKVAARLSSVSQAHHALSLARLLESAAHESLTGASASASTAKKIGYGPLQPSDSAGSEKPDNSASAKHDRNTSQAYGMNMDPDVE
ncbi:hypothetical protein FRB96_004810 [Tulasnella sp. 330]|nr:hypothetical protein FRB96_004810 [Tulasnella sp. 330]KAG8877463.1 hypothetical protein FRB97_003394 [Tulasnella sp. 331]KAG8883320.1 hypothetical protein FRB98_003166 [Tulasnella sp. 332]